MNIQFIFIFNFVTLDFFTKSLSGWPCEWSHAAMRRLVAVGAAQNVLQATYTDTGLGKCRLEVYTQSSSGNHILGLFHRPLVRRKPWKPAWTTVGPLLDHSFFCKSPNYGITCKMGVAPRGAAVIFGILSGVQIWASCDQNSSFPTGYGACL